jgi:DNA-binding PadR family transcriptional regulator
VTATATASGRTSSSHLRGLEDEGLLTPVAAPKGEADERRIYYRLTPAGRRALAAELARLRDLVRLAEKRGLLAAHA